MDEVHTFIKSKNKSCYITYALNKTTRKIIDFVVGDRTKENIGKVIQSLKQLHPLKVFTYKINVYPGLIDRAVHIAGVHYKDK